MRMFPWISRLFVGLLTGFSLLGPAVQATQAAPIRYPESEPQQLAPLSPPAMREVIRLGLHWLETAQTPGGHFHYEYAPFWDRYSLDDNMVRQAGAFYLLGEVLARPGSAPYAAGLRTAMKRALGFYQRRTIAGSAQGRRFRCVLKLPGKCSLGATALVLAGSLRLVQAYPELEPVYAPLIADYLAYHLAMKIPGQGFRVAYYPDQPLKDVELSFANGEAFLALARYEAYRPSPEVRAVLGEAFGYYRRLYGTAPDNNFYLWGMAAIKDLQRLPAFAPEQPAFVAFVKAYTDWRVAGYRRRRASDHNYAAYVEGIVSAYSVLEPTLTPREKAALRAEIDFWLARTAQLQLQANSRLTLGVEGQPARSLGPRNETRALGGFLTGFNEPYQRIDFTQHALSACLQTLTDIDHQSL